MPVRPGGGAQGPRRPDGGAHSRRARQHRSSALRQDAANPNPAEALRACQEEPEPGGAEGWCYIADTDTQKVGNPELVAACPPTKRQVLRFVGRGLGRNTTTFVACQGSSLAAQNNQ